MIMEAEEFKVLIVGSGCTGLTIAQGLKQAGIQYQVFEQLDVNRVRPRDWGMALHWGMDFLLPCIPEALGAKLKSALVNPAYDRIDEGYPFCNGVTGELLKMVPAPSPHRFSRRKLRELLAEGIDVTYGKKLQSLTPHETSVTLQFEDGTQETGSLVIGADGGRSAVREYLVGPDASRPQDTGLTMINFAYTYTEAEVKALTKIHPIFKAGFLPRSKFMNLLALLDAPDPERPETWRYQNWTSWQGRPYASELQDPRARMKFFKEHSAKLGDPWRAAGLAIDDDFELPIDPLQVWAPDATNPWDNKGGKVTLAGDAAHSMPPYRGQGLNNAIEDASHLVQAIISVVKHSETLGAAIALYEKEMVPRGAKEVRLSLDQARLSHDWDTLYQSPYFRNAGMRKVDGEVRGEYNVVAA